MPVRARFVSLLRTLARGARLDADLDAELRAHVDLLTDEKLKAGLGPAAARRAALLEVGGVEQVKERVRDVRVGIWLDTLWQDVRYAVRGFRKAPWFTITAIASLAVGIGLNTAIFSAIDAVVLRPLPYKDPDRIVTLSQTNSLDGPGAIGIAPAIADEWQRRSTVFDALGLYDSWSLEAVVAFGQDMHRVDALRVSAGFFDALGVPPLIGRAFTAADDRPDWNVAVLGYDFWRRHWRDDPGVVGRDLRIDGSLYRVVGIMPERFRFYHELTMMDSTSTDVYLSDPWKENPRTNKWSFRLMAVGRLKPGVTFERAVAEVASIARSTEYGVPPRSGFGVMGARLARLHDDVIGGAGSRLFFVWGVAAIVLVLAALNLASLLMARAGARRAELGVRAAIGASRGRLIRQLLIESVLLALAGGFAGLLLAFWAAPLLAAFLPDTRQMARLREAGVNGRMLLFTFGAAMLTGVAFGLIPALGGSRGELRPPIVGSHRVTDRRGTTRARSVLLVAQLALSVVLLVSAGLMIVTIERQNRMALGFNPDRLLTCFIRYPIAEPYVRNLGLHPFTWPPDAPLPPNAPLGRFFALTPHTAMLPLRLQEAVEAVPGVEDVTLGSAMPMVRTLSWQFSLPDQPNGSARDREQMIAVAASVTPSYFKTLGVRLLAGRPLADMDRPGTSRVAVINRAMARKYWSHEAAALGDRVTFGNNADASTIVGVVDDLRFWPWAEPTPQVFMPLVQDVADRYPIFLIGFRLEHQFAVRVREESPAVVDAIRQAIARVDNGAPLERVRFMRQAMAEGLGNTRALARLLSSAAALALALAAIGIFGVVSYIVWQRTHEIGVRIAVGASRRAILQLVLATGLRLALAGASIGLVASYWLTGLIARELYDISPTDPWIFAAVTTVLVAIVLLAAWLPARRAASLDPLVTLRGE